ncbi:MAG: PEP-CTERM sorting domain-containing protein [Rhodocyclaceae bacterium]|nr:PEP-CTERM sorting domain-containing protein [Rhodocyclaceae bacterium]
MLTFFADNLVGPGQDEFVDGKVSLIRLYDFELDVDEVGEIDPNDNGGDNLGGGTDLPEPGSLALLGLGLAALSARRRR